jgi:uncharacterized protein (TIRG00374 family)
MIEANQANRPNSKKSYKWTQIVLRLIVASVILIFIFDKIPISEVSFAINQTRLEYAFAAFFFAFLVHIGASIRLKKLCEMQNINLSVYEVFKINTSSRFYSLFLPGGNFTGIAIRFYRLSVFNQKYAQAIVTMLYDRILATIALCLLGLLFGIIEVPRETDSYLKMMIIALAISFIILIATALIKPASVLAEWLNRFKFSKFNLIMSSAVYRQQLSSRVIYNMFLLSCIIHIFGIVSYYLISIALGLNLSLVSIGWIRSAVILVTMVPVSISGIGLREGAIVILLNIHNIQPSDALAFSFIIFLITVLGVGIIGGIFEVGRLLK